MLSARRRGAVDRRRGRRDVEVEPLRLEILDQEGRLGERLRPSRRRRRRSARCRAWRSAARLTGVTVPPRPWSCSVTRLSSLPSGRVTIAVSGTFSTAFGRGVAHERGRVDRLADAVDAALGGQEHVERLRRLAALDAAVGQVHRRLGEVEEAVVAGIGLRRRAGPAPCRRCRGSGPARSWRSPRRRSSPRRAPRC